MAINGVTKVTKFCGASLVKLQSRAGWQEQISTLRVDLVEDPVVGDRFIVPETGTPLSMVFEGFRFDGLVQRYGKSKSPSGDPLYNVQLSSPVEILDCVQIILDVYRGVNTNCPNLLNVFGYLESGGAGFGGSGKNPGGIPWNNIKFGLEAIQGGGTEYGSGIEYKGHKYILDLGAIPQTPDFYRIGAGLSMDLNAMLHQVFQDCGYDFLVCLKVSEGKSPNVIFFKTRSRLTLQPLGQIEAFAESRSDIVSFESGAELRNDITCGIIFGGQQETCIPLTDPGDYSVIYQFWGYQQSASLTFGLEGNAPIVESSGKGNDHTAILNAAPIADVLGNSSGGLPTYTCSVLEMRLALVDFDSWSVFIARNRPDVPDLLGLDVFPSVYGTVDFKDLNPQSMYTDNAKSASFFSDQYNTKNPLEDIHKLYDFVKDQANTYLGKQFMVRIPFWLKYYFEQETSRLLFNMELNGDGYYPDYLGGFSSGPLGLNYENFNRFSNDSGKFMPFIKYGGADTAFADVSSKNSDDLIIQNRDIYVPCSVNSSIIFTPAPAAICTLNEALWYTVPDPVGGIIEVADMLNMDPDLLRQILVLKNGDFPVKIHPPPLSPVGAAICLKNHETTYGPWTNIGVPGKVDISQNEDLVPWNYGGFETMNTAANDQLASIGAQSQVEESGQVIITSAPEISLGDQLNGAGPVVTSIDVEIGEGGVTTTYIMQSQTAVYGAFSKQNAERLRRLGVAAQDIRRKLRAMADTVRQNNRIAATAGWAFLTDRSRAVTFQQATNIFHGTTFKNPTTGNYETQLGSNTFAGGVGNSNAHDDQKYQATGSMGMEGLLRPFSTNPYNTMLPNYEKAVANTGISNKDLDPFQKGSDMLWRAGGTTYDKNGFKAKSGEDDANPDIRPMGIRFPIVGVGFGREISGRPVPNSAEIPQTPPSGNTTPTLPAEIKIQDMTDNFSDNYLVKSNQWKAGPVDLRWNKWRKVWGFPGILIGTYKLTNGKTTIALLGVPDEIEIKDPNYFGGTFTNGQKICIAYYDLTDKWYIIAAACS